MVMATTNVQKVSQKILEVKIRPYSNQANQERPDQKGASRVHLSKDALLDLRLDAGQICYLWKLGNEDTGREAVAWPTTEKSLSKKVIQISKSFQEACGFKLGDDLYVRAGGDLKVAENVVLREVKSEEEDVPELKDGEKPGWEWYLADPLDRAEVVFSGMVFRNLLHRRERRAFIVQSVNGNSNALGRFDQSSFVTISSTSSGSMVLNGSRAGLELADIAGIDQALAKLNGFLKSFQRQFKSTIPKRSCGVLLHGGHGTGKTFLIEKIINTGWSRNVFHVEYDSKASELRDIFKKAKSNQPSIVIIDELDSIVSKDDSTSHLFTKIIGQEMDSLLTEHSPESKPQVLVIASSLDSSSIPLPLKRRGRFRTEISLPIPDPVARKQILKSLAHPIRPEQRDDILEKLGDRTHAYTAEDLVSLMDAACDIAEDRWESSESAGQDFFMSQDDIEQARLLVKPTAMHDITLQPPPVRWAEIGGQTSVKNALRLAVETPLKHPELMKRMGVAAKKGVLLYGPPGCSKTLSAQAMATEVGFNFFAVKGAELLNMYVGESERAVRNIFARARAASPSIIFFDEIEAIGAKRESGRNNGVNVLTTLLNEMDGIETLKGVMVLAATNQPQALDLALLRPGRFDELLYVAPPDLAGRQEILRIRQSRMDAAPDIDIAELARLTEGYSGAELVSICQKACYAVIEKCVTTEQELQVHMEDILNAISTVKRQITPELIEGYERWASGARDDTN